jgi:mevalonate kinase
MISATAPGKVILFGEHAVVYGRPALAAPITHLRARATIEPTGKPDVALIAPDLNRLAWLSNVHPHNPAGRTLCASSSGILAVRFPTATPSV